MAWSCLEFHILGGYHGLLLIAHRFIRNHISIPKVHWSKWKQHLWWGFRVGMMFHCTCYGWLLFRANDADQVIHFTRQLFFGLTLSPEILPLCIHLILFSWPLILMQILQGLLGKLNVIHLLPWPVRSVIYALGFYLVLIFGVFGSREFIYFQF